MIIKEIIDPSYPEGLVDLDEAKLYCRYTENDDDQYIQDLILLASEHIERYTRRIVAKRRYEMTLDSFPYWEIIFPKQRIANVISLKYRNLEGEFQDVDPSLYDLQISKEPGFLIRKSGMSWPKASKEPGSVILEYEAGWGIDELPKSISVAAKSLVKFYYHERDLVSSAATKTPSWLHTLLFPYKAHGDGDA